MSQVLDLLAEVAGIYQFEVGCQRLGTIKSLLRRIYGDFEIYCGVRIYASTVDIPRSLY
jgi:hypothetical protein